jgi:integrase
MGLRVARSENWVVPYLSHIGHLRTLAAGVPVPPVSGRLGHANSSTTLNVYAHFFEASDRDAADVMGNVLGPGD